MILGRMSKAFSKKEKHNQKGMVVLFFSVCQFPVTKVGLPTAAIGQNWHHIRHHSGCNDEKLNRDLLHGITSSRMDLSGHSKETNLCEEQDEGQEAIRFLIIC